MPKIPGTTAVAKTAQKSIQKWLGKGSKEILEHVATEAPDLYKATAKSTLDGFGYAIDSKLVEPDDAIAVFKNGDVDTLQDFSAQGIAKQRQAQMADQLNSVAERTVEEAQVAKDQFVTEMTAKYQTGLTGEARTSDINLARQRKTNTVSLGDPNIDDAERLKDIETYIKFNEEIGKKGQNKGLFKQPRKGWEGIFGHKLDEDGYLMRVSGGMESSTDPAKFVTTKDLANRKIDEGIYLRDELPSRKTAMKGFHKHHVDHIKNSAPFGYLADGTPRSAADMGEIEARLRRRGVLSGNKDWNEMYLSGRAHLGKKGDELASLFGVHPSLKRSTDIQGFEHWKTEAREILYEFPAKEGGTAKRYKWIKNTPVLNAKNELVGSTLQTGRRNMEGAQAIKFRMPGSSGTYNVGQKHGFSMELLDTISRMEDPDEVVDAIELFLKDSGAGDAMKGAAALAFQVVDAGKSTDEITKILSRKYTPQMVEYAENLLEHGGPKYKDNPILKKIIEMNKGGSENPVWSMTPLDKENYMKDLIGDLQSGKKVVETQPGGSRTNISDRD